MLISCPECSEEISSRAVSCPYCGCPEEEIEEAARREAKREAEWAARREAAKLKAYERKQATLGYRLFVFLDDRGCLVPIKAAFLLLALALNWGIWGFDAGSVL